jgi:hypothetical protein
VKHFEEGLKGFEEGLKGFEEGLKGFEEGVHTSLLKRKSNYFMCYIFVALYLCTLSSIEIPNAI